MQTSSINIDHTNLQHPSTSSVDVDDDDKRYKFNDRRYRIKTRINRMQKSTNDYLHDLQIGNSTRINTRTSTSYDCERFFDASPMYQKDVLGHHGCVNALELSPNGERFIATGIVFSSIKLYCVCC